MYDAVVVMYYDHGHVLITLIGFQHDQEMGARTTLAGVSVL